jgi:hypothetical protein
VRQRDKVTAIEQHFCGDFLRLNILQTTKSNAVAHPLLPRSGTQTTSSPVRKNTISPAESDKLAENNAGSLFFRDE